ncbi:MAG TPA: trypsin-like peptidase domain-containing protein, partial [Candidatus Paceibacterota bacterium]|nr:trypsin-like peptidase domain-containing protein [Candidatus Paceibacterota bacterium]
MLRSEVMFSDEEKTIAAVHRVAPAVVSITMSKTMSEARGSFLDSMLNPELLPKTHGKKSNDPLNLGLPAITPPSNEKVKVGGGSGFIVDSSGIILTNKHVVFDEKADYVVTTADEQELPAKVVTRDPVNDIAILKVEATGLPTVTMNTRRVEPGQSVLAIGNALGLFSN